MYQTSSYPLRTIIGDPIKIDPTNLESNIQIIEESDASQELRLGYEFKYKSNLAATETDSNYKNYFPIFESSAGVSVPGDGMDSLPIPPNPLPFPKNTPIISLFGLSNKLKKEEVSRQLSVKLHIKLAQASLVGGICFGGFPFLPYKLQTNGQNSANFGLPREIRLTSAHNPPTFLDMGKTDGFLDFENSVTRQEIVSHSSFHYLQIDPTLTDSLILHLSDYPTFLTKFTLSRRREQPFPVLEERYGFIIPYFYVFTYQEKTRYKPRVPAGLLGARYENASSSLQVEYKHEEGTQRNKSYYEFTAASIFGQQRSLVRQDSIIMVSGGYTEAFISKQVKPGEKVTLYLQQAEEYQRCIAGLKMLFPFVPKVGLDDDLEEIAEKLSTLNPNQQIDLGLLVDIPREELEKHLRGLLGIPAEINFCEKIGIRVYELDPVEGVSPLLVPLEGKYATLLAERQVDELWEILHSFTLEGLRFIRPSTAKYFAIELTNLDDEPGQFMVRFLQFIQSAHVSIHPRASRTQQVSALHFRLIGPNLADDYALLGNQGFNFSIERLVAGERKNVLIRVNSLLDLLHTGAAKIFSNGRRRGVEREISKIDGEEREHNYESRITEVGGWRSSETGAGVKNEVGWTAPPGNFQAVSSQETSTLSEILAPQHSINSWMSAAIIGNILNGIYQPGTNTLDFLSGILSDRNLDLNNLPQDVINEFMDRILGDNQSLLAPTYTNTPLLDGFEHIWKGLGNSDRLKVRGITNVTASPFGINRIGKEFLDFFGLFSFPSMPPDYPFDPITFFRGQLVANAYDVLNSIMLILGGQGIPFLALNTLNSMGSSVSASPGGVGLSLSGSLIFPSYSQNFSFGTQGNKTLQATRNEYAFSQYKNASFDEITTHIVDGKSRRIVAREAVEGKDHKRIKGAEVMWQGQLNDILTGSIPLNFTLPATASKEHYRTADDSLRVRFGSGIGPEISVDFWFDIVEEVIQDDY